MTRSEEEERMSFDAELFERKGHYYGHEKKFQLLRTQPSLNQK